MPSAEQGASREEGQPEGRAVEHHLGAVRAAVVSVAMGRAATARAAMVRAAIVGAAAVGAGGLE